MYKLNLSVGSGPFVFAIAGFLLLFALLSVNAEFTLIGFLVIIVLFLLLGPFKEYLPIIFLIAIWYIPGQTAPRGLLEEHLIFRWITHIAIPFMTAFYFAKDLVKKKTWDLSPFFLPMICLFILICVSAVYNKSNLLDLASCISIYLRYPLLFLLLINWDIKDSSLEKIIPCFFILLLAQIPETLFRALIWEIRWDEISYTLGSYGSFPLGIYCLYAIAFLTAQATVNGLKLYHIVLIHIFLLIAGLGEIKALFIFSGPVIFITVLFFRVKTKTIISRFIPITAIVALALYFVFKNWEILTGGGVNFLDNLVLYIKLLFEGRSSYELPYISRIDQINIIANMLMSSPVNFFIGFGPGSSLAGNFSGSPGVVAAAMSRMIWAGVLLIQYVAVVGDLGFLGLIFFGFLFVRILKFILGCRNIFSDPKHKIYAGAFTGIFSFYAFLGPFYNIVWRYDGSNFLMWGLLAILYRRYSSQVRKKTARIIRDRVLDGSSTGTK
jgi:hypothetical protein